MPIANDQEFKAALAALTAAQQRQVAARFLQPLYALSNDARVRGALELAVRPEPGRAELDMACQAANSARVESFTRCGRECDWSDQAGHFVARAAALCVAPDPAADLAWQAAMQTRMARSCQAVAEGGGTDNREAEAQYRILEAFLNY